MSTWGAGNPTPTNFVPSWGAGEPTPVAFVGTPWGAGDPTTSVLSVALLPAQPGDHLFPDDGGSVVLLAAAWLTKGPYLVTLRESHTAQTFPAHGEAGKGLNCYLTPDGDLLAALPAAPPGLYDVDISWATGAVTAAGALRVIWRERSPEQWTLAAMFRAKDRTGARSNRDAVLLGV